MKKTLLVILFSVGVGLAFPALAADAIDNPADPEATEFGGRADMFQDARQKLRGMSRQEKRTLIETTQKKWDALSTEEKEAFKTKVKPQADRQKMIFEKRCQELKSNPDRIYLRLYTLDQLQAR